MTPPAAAPAQEIVWEPTDRQSAFLACDDFEVLYGGAAGGGKALDVMTPIPTPGGWKEMGDLKPGDHVFDESGSPCVVLAVSEIMVGRPCYRVVFSDGAEIVADEQHLWPTLTAADRQAIVRNTPEFREARRQARARRGKGKRPDLTEANQRREHDHLPPPHPSARTTGEICNSLTTGKSGRLNHSIAVAGAIDLPEAILPIDPYILGLWLGDGRSNAGSFTTADDEIINAFQSAGYVVTKQSGKYAYGTIGLASRLREAHVLGSKHVPDIYLRASTEQRLALVQGLMDTDGYCDRRGQCEFTTTSIELAVGMHELLVSLGVKASICSGRATLYGREISEKYRIKFQTEMPAFRLPRKLERQKRDGFRGTHDRRYVVAVEPVQTRPVRCIAVSSPSHCYLAGKDMVPTHNSDALLIDCLCLQHGGLTNPRHRAVLFRRSFPELRDLIDRSIELYPDIANCSTDAYNKTEKIWTLPSGAKIEFGYLQNDADRLKYRGRAWNYIGFDELTLWATSVCYLYLFSRCRSTDRTLPRYIRSTTNPDGPGQKWVMERWGIQEDGKETCLPVDIEDEELGTVTTMHRRFIPARLTDNRHLSGTGYREALLQLGPEEREALLKGLWRAKSARGAYYAREMQKLRAEGRIRRVPYTPGEPVNTFWDLGWNDTTAIWFHQFIAGEHRFIHAYENSGESLDHYAQYLLARGYALSGTHNLPHDAENKSLQTGKSTIEILRGLLPGLRFEVVPRVEAVLTGINETRLKLGGNVFIDATECADGIAALDNYRKTYSEKLDSFTETPVHDRFSNYADAFRQWGQGWRSVAVRAGQRPIRSKRIGGMAI